jgi:peptidylprolyl isomerase
MGSKERLVLIVLSVALAGGLVALVLTKGREKQAQREAQSREAQQPDRPTLGAPAPEGWDLARIPVAGTPTREEDHDGVIVQVIEPGEGDPLPEGQPVDLQYRIYTLDGVQRMRGTWTRITPGAQGSLPPGIVTGLQGIRMFERRRLLVPADQMQGRALTGRVPPDREGVIDVRPVQVVIEDIVEGSGRAAQLNDRITVHYVGKLPNGVTFDSSVKKGRPATFTIARGRLIQGWVDAIPGMKVGGKRRLWIPSHLAYGPRSAGPKVPPYSDLMFDIELLGIK